MFQQLGAIIDFGLLRSIFSDRGLSANMLLPRIWTRPDEEAEELMPTPAKELQKELRYGNVTAHRYFDCPHYQKCLEEAVKKYWVSFSCRNCPEFKEYKKTQGAAKVR